MCANLGLCFGTPLAFHLGRCPMLVWAGPLARFTPSDGRTRPVHVKKNPNSSPGTPSPTPAPRPHRSPNQRAWRRFRRNRLTLASGFFLVALALLILVWPLFDLPGIAPRLFKAMTCSPTTLSEAQFQPPDGE